MASMKEKGQRQVTELPSTSWYSQRPSQGVSCKRRALGIIIGLAGLTVSAQLVHRVAHFSCFKSSHEEYPLDSSQRQAVCPQVGQLLPDANKDLWDKLSGQISSDEFKATAINWLGGAVRVP